MIGHLSDPLFPGPLLDLLMLIQLPLGLPTRHQSFLHPRPAGHSPRRPHRTPSMRQGSVSTLRHSAGQFTLASSVAGFGPRHGPVLRDRRPLQLVFRGGGDTIWSPFMDDRSRFKTPYPGSLSLPAAAGV